MTPEARLVGRRALALFGFLSLMATAGAITAHMLVELAVIFWGLWPGWAA